MVTEISPTPCRLLRILLTADPELPVPPLGYGGIERIVDALVRGFRAQGHTVGLVAHPDSTAAANCRFSWPGRNSRGLANTLKNMMALRGAVRSFKPDVVHSFSRLNYLLPLLPGRLPKLMSYQRHTGGRQVKLASSLAGPSLGFTGCSEYIAAMGRKSGGTWQAIHNFVEIEKFTFSAVVAPDAPLVFLSRIDSIKGADTAIAIARATGRRLIIAGNHATSGPEANYWREKIDPELGKNDIEWFGEVGDTAKNGLLGGAAALVVPIRWDEPFGIVFAEALACGTPVITCQRGALDEIVTHGQNGFFISTVADGVAAVSRLGEIDRRECRRTAENKFTASVAVSAYLALYRTMIANNQPGSS